MLRLEQRLNAAYGNNEIFKITIENLRDSEVNILKQMMTIKVKCYASKLINIIVNESGLRSPELCHRIGLVPIINDRLSIENRNKNKMYQCEIDVFNSNNEIYDLYSNSIELLDLNGARTGIFPFAEDFKITQLRPKQSLHLFIFINKSTGEEHIKYRTCKCQKFKEKDGIYNLEFTNFGMVDTEKIIKSAIKECKKYNILIET